MPSQGEVGKEIRQFLMTRRARLQPQEVGLPPYSGRRRVSGLRREEVAMLAGISVEYYNRIERGNAKGVSDDVLESLARALQLDDVERSHLIALAGAANKPSAARSRVAAPNHQLRPALQQLLDAMTQAAVFVRSARLDILAANQLGSALYSPVLRDTIAQRNLARFIFLSPDAIGFYRDWTGIAHAAVGSLRTMAGHRPADPPLMALIDELASGSKDFHTLWESGDVEYYRAGVQHFHHPAVGDIDLDYDALEVAADPGLTVIAYTAHPDSAAANSLALLANWTATLPT